MRIREKLRKLVLPLLGFFLWGAPVTGQSVNLDEDTRVLCNEVMQNIADEVEALQSRYPELMDFEKDDLVKNRQDIYTLEYQYPASSGGGSGPLYAFGITIVKMNEENIFLGKENLFSLGFPLLNVKFIGYQIRSLKHKQFDILGPVRTQGQLLWDKQQDYLPVRLSLQSVKESYEPGEAIDFAVTLKNLTRKNIKVKDLNEETLYFLYNNAVWGAEELEPQKNPSTKEIILKPLASIRKKFRGEGVNTPKEFEIYGSYSMTYKGVNPTATLKITIEERPE